VNIEDFYSADERRRDSEEIELGTEWHDKQGARYELSWVVDTGELYTMLEPNGGLYSDPFGDIYESRESADDLTVAVVGWIPERSQLESVLGGWAEQMDKPDGISWVASRLEQAGIPRSAPAA
jgi:hypothetical protein